MMPRGSDRNLFRNTLECELFSRINTKLTERDAEESHGGRIWSAEWIEERRAYHCLRNASFAIINSLIKKALNEAAVEEALKQARRFAVDDRYDIYRATADSVRALQLSEAFPVLALAIYSGANRSPLERSQRKWRTAGWRRRGEWSAVDC